MDTITEDDLQLALYCCYELHYGSFPGVDDQWEWEPSLLWLRRELERRFESDLRSGVGEAHIHPEGVVPHLWELATSSDGPSLSGWVEQNGTLEHFREFAKHRSAYQLKEADPHTWGIPRLDGPAKAAMVAIQFDEYGGGSFDQMHSALFAETLRCLGLRSTQGAYLDELPGTTLATTNLISLFGLHRRLRGALVGHLALFEMTSVDPMTRYSNALRRLGIPESGRRFYDVHVTADQVHQHLAADGMAGALVEQSPELASDIVFGARALGLVEARFAQHVLDCWHAGRSSLRRPTGASLHANDEEDGPPHSGADPVHRGSSVVVVSEASSGAPHDNGQSGRCARSEAARYTIDEARGRERPQRTVRDCQRRG
jgi:hypothetical protein